MATLAERLARKVLGPYDVLDVVANSGAREPQPIASFPFTEVEGGSVSVVLVENVSIGPAGGTFSEAMIEVQIVGIVQGQEDVLKTAWITGLTGPVRKTFETWDVYETIVIKARNMMGGRPRGNVDPANAPPVNQGTSAGFFARLTVNLQPRKGINRG